MSLKNNAFATRQSYVRGLKALILHYQKLPEHCTPDEIIAFLSDLKNSGNYSSSTINLRVCGIKFYCRYVVQRLDLVVKIPNPRVQKYDTEILIPDEVIRIRKACRDMRQLLIVTLLYDTGIRVRELVRLRVSDFDKHHRTIMIRNSKGNKSRVVPYGDQLRNVMIRYCKARGGVPENTLLESYKQKNQPLTKRGVQHIVRQIVKRAGIKKTASPHTFRHSFAVHYLNHGGSLFQLQRLMGHEYISTTLNYLKYAKIPEAHRISVLDLLLMPFGNNQ